MIDIKDYETINIIMNFVIKSKKLIILNLTYCGNQLSISDKESSSEAIEKLLLLKDFSIGPTDRRFIEVVGVKGLRYVYNLREKNAIIYK